MKTEREGETESGREGEMKKEGGREGGRDEERGREGGREGEMKREGGREGGCVQVTVRNQASPVTMGEQITWDPPKDQIRNSAWCAYSTCVCSPLESRRDCRQ